MFIQNPFVVAVAFALITSPAVNEEDDYTCLKDIPHICNAMRIVSTELEILDTREYYYMFARKDELWSDFNSIRERFKCHKDSPRLMYAELIPFDRDAIQEFLNFNREYRNYLEMQQSFLSENHPKRRWYDDAIAETKQLYDLWDAMRDAKTTYYYVTLRRRGLQQAKNMMGPEMFYSGETPPFVPIWRFQVLK